MLAQLEHLSRDQDAPLRRPHGQRMNHRLQSFRIGVVAVIKNSGAGNLQHLAALAARRERCERRNRSLECDSSFERYGESGDSVLSVVRTEKIEVEASVVLAGTEVHVEARRIFLHIEN